MNAFVTGGAGFLGTEVVRQLQVGGHMVTSASRRSGVDICNFDTLRRAMEGHDIVFHVAALPGVWGKTAEFEATNVGGTENVVRACLDLGIRKLVFTGSPSSVFDGKDHLDAGNDLPYPERFEADYPRTKAAAERIVLSANSPELATVSLRPHLIYGPADTWLLPRVFDRARKRRLRIVGPGKNLVSLTYIENAAGGHLQAAAALEYGAPCAGKPFFITDPDPVELWPWLNELLVGVGIAPVTGHVPLGVAHAAGSIAEWVWRTFSLSGDPIMTRFMAGQLGTSHTYSLAPAQEAFGYVPPVSNAEAFRRTVEWWRSRVG